MENGPVEIVDFPINSMVIFHGKMLVHQRVPCCWLNMVKHEAAIDVDMCKYIPIDSLDKSILMK